MGYHGLSVNQPPSEYQNMRRSLLVPLLAAVLTAGCVTVYTPDVQQGNVVTQEMLDKLRPGMTRSQVRFVLGTPLVADLFHPDRWDYYFSLKKGNEAAAETRALAIIFDKDALQRIEGDTVIRATPDRTPVTNGTAVNPTTSTTTAPATVPRAL
jgi:outer membrane protein assembly factor BamE